MMMKNHGRKPKLPRMSIVGTKDSVLVNLTDRRRLRLEHVHSHSDLILSTFSSTRRLTVPDLC